MCIRDSQDPISFLKMSDRMEKYWQPDREHIGKTKCHHIFVCLLYTSDAADERSSVDLGGRRIIKKKKKRQ